MAVVTKNNAVKRKRKPTFVAEDIIFCGSMMRIPMANYQDLIMMSLIMALIELHGIEFYEMLRDRYKMPFPKEVNDEIIFRLMQKEANK